MALFIPVKCLLAFCILHATLCRDNLYFFQAGVREREREAASDLYCFKAAFGSYSREISPLNEMELFAKKKLLSRSSYLEKEEIIRGYAVVF